MLKEYQSGDLVIEKASNVDFQILEMVSYLDLTEPRMFSTVVFSPWLKEHCW